MNLDKLGIRKHPRKLNEAFFRDLGKMAAAGAGALAYEEWIVRPVVERTMLDRKLTVPEIAMNLLAGWGPLLAAGALSKGEEGNPMFAAFGGAVCYKRISNLAQAVMSRGIVG